MCGNVYYQSYSNGSIGKSLAAANVPADLIALLVRLAVNLGLASSALTQSDSLAIITPNSLKSES